MNILSDKDFATKKELVAKFAALWTAKSLHKLKADQFFNLIFSSSETLEKCIIELERGGK